MNRESAPLKEIKGTKLLLIEGRKKGFLTYEEIGGVFDGEAVWTPYLEDLLSKLEEEGIRVVEEEAEKEELGKVKEGKLPDFVNLYLREIFKFPILSREDERKLVKGIEINRAKLNEIELELNLPLRKIKHLFMARREKDKDKKIDFNIIPGINPEKVKENVKKIIQIEAKIEENKKIIIESNLRLVVRVAKRYHHVSLSFLDLIAEGNIGLMRAIDKFDYKQGYRFCTYAIWWIRHAINRAIVNKGQIIRLPVYISEIIDKCMKVTHILSNKLGREPSLEEIAGELNMPLMDIVRAINASRHPSSLEASVVPGNKTKFIDIIEDRRRMTPEKNVFWSSLCEKIESLLSEGSLEEREKEIIKLRYGLAGNNPLTLKEIGQMYGITRERVRQIEERTLFKLRHLQITEELRDFLAD